MSTTMTPEINPPQPSQPALGEMERITNMFHAPTMTFEDLKRNSSWFIPILLYIVLSITFVKIIDVKIGWPQVVDNILANLPEKQKDRLAQATPEQQAQQRDAMIKGYKYGSYIIGPVFILILYTVLAGIYMASMNFGMGAELRYKQCLAVVSYAGIPSILRSCLAMAMPFIIKDPSTFNMQNPVVTNLGFLVSQASHPALYTLASFMDVFAIWSMVLSGIGLACISGKKTSTAMMVVVGWFVAFVALFTGLALLRS